MSRARILLKLRLERKSLEKGINLKWGELLIVGDGRFTLTEAESRDIKASKRKAKMIFKNQSNELKNLNSSESSLLPKDYDVYMIEDSETP
jgi:hypothetical protein